MRVLVQSPEHLGVTPGDTVATGKGVTDDGDGIVFAGEWRAILALREHIEANGPTECEIEPWQVLERIPRKPGPVRDEDNPAKES